MNNKLLVFFSVYPRLIILSILLILSKKLVSIRVNSWLKKIGEKMKNKPNGMLSKPHFKLNNGDFGNFRGPYYEKQTQWYVIY